MFASGESGKIVQTIVDDQGNTVVTSTFAIRRGSGEWQLKSTFTVPVAANSVCDRMIMTIDGSSRVLESPYGGCHRMQESESPPPPSAAATPARNRHPRGVPLPPSGFSGS